MLANEKYGLEDARSDMSIQILHPPGWPRPKGYASGTLATGRQVFVSGQLGWNEKGKFASTRLSDQARTALENVLVVLAQTGARPEHVARLTWYIIDCNEYHAQRQEIGVAYREIMGSHYPAMTMVQVAALVEPAARVEIEAIAFL